MYFVKMRNKLVYGRLDKVWKSDKNAWEYLGYYIEVYYLMSVGSLLYLFTRKFDVPVCYLRYIEYSCKKARL